MVRDVGEPLSKYFLGSYTIPTFHIHATLASALDRKPLEVRREEDRKQGEFTLVNATLIMLFLLYQQADMFHLGLEGAVKKCDALFGEVWKLETRRQPL
jgi:hypothetical protein